MYEHLNILHTMKIAKLLEFFELENFFFATFECFKIFEHLSAEEINFLRVRQFRMHFEQKKMIRRIAKSLPF